MDWCSDHGCEYVRIGGPIELRPHYHILLITGSHSLSTRDTVGTFTMAEALTSQKLFTCKCAVASRIFLLFFDSSQPAEESVIDANFLSWFIMHRNERAVFTQN